MNTGPGCMCQPLCPPGWNVMVWTAMSKPGLDLSSMCQGPVTRCTLKTGSEGSLNVARPRRTELEPDPIVCIGSTPDTPVEPGATGSSESLHPTRSDAQMIA